jgi:Mg-chelatase subunit ChlD
MLLRILRVLLLVTIFTAPAVDAQTLGLDILEFDASRYRTITARVRATLDGNAIRNLSMKNFDVRENGVTMSSLVTMCEDSAAALPVSALLVIDRSGSMLTSLAAAKAAAKNFVNRLSPDDEMALLSFTNVPSYDQPWTQNKAMMNSRIDALQVPFFGGGTALWDAIERGTVVLAEGTKRKVMIILSDGDDRDSQSTYAQAKNAVLSDNILVYTIGLGTGIDVATLTDLAVSTGGKYFSAPTTADLDRIYQEISSQIATTGICTLTWESQLDCLDGSVVNVEMVLEAANRTLTVPLSYTRPYDSTTLSFVSLAIDRDLVVETGETITVPIVLSRVTPLRAPDRFTFTLTYDKSLLELISADTTSLSAGYAVAQIPSSAGATIGMTGPRSIVSPGTLLLLTFRALDTWESRTSEIGVSLPEVGRSCTFPSAEAGLVTISGRCERAMIRDTVTATTIRLLPPSPNPFNPTTHIVYRLSQDGVATLTLHDAAGRRVRTLVDERVRAGEHQLMFDGSQLATGPYFLTLRALGKTETRRLLLVK